jgi:phospholipid/cholesterol/gamma-HCH transport system substrate-binding protein
METRAHYVLVGAVTLGIAVLAAIFALWLARANFNAEYAQYKIVFEGPVRGLIKGGEVRFNGIKVGEIIELSLDPNNTSKVNAFIRVDRTTPVTISSEARLESVGLTGVNLIQLTAGDAADKDKPLLRRPGERVPTIVAKKGALDDLVAAGKSIADQANEALASVNSALTPENVKSLTATIKNLEATSAMLADKQGAIARSADAAASLRDAADSIRKLADSTALKMDKVDSVLVEAKRAATAVADAADNARNVSNSASEAADVAAFQALPDISSAARDLRRVAMSLDRVAGQVETGQTSLVGGGAPRPTIKVRP